jgi:hypothetical protein
MAMSFGYPKGKRETYQKTSGCSKKKYRLKQFVRFQKLSRNDCRARFYLNRKDGKSRSLVRTGG